MAHAALVIEQNPIEDLDERTDIDVKAGLFQDLARDAGFERLTKLEHAAGEAPLPGERLVLALHEQHLAGVGHHHRPDADARALDLSGIARCRGTGRTASRLAPHHGAVPENQSVLNPEVAV